MMHDAAVSILRAREKVLCSVVCGEVGLATHRAHTHTHAYARTHSGVLTGL